MPTLITMTVGSARARICGARCYHAKGDDCQCICGGRNHGKGFKEAHRTTAHEVVKIMAENQRKLKDTTDERPVFTLPPFLEQIEIDFDEEDEKRREARA